MAGLLVDVVDEAGEPALSLLRGQSGVRRQVLHDVEVATHPVSQACWGVEEKEAKE